MAVEQFYAQLGVAPTHYEFTFSDASVPDAGFEFSLCRKETTLGDLPIYQFWMPIRSLYHQRRQQAINYRPIIDAWWAICERGGTQCERDTQQSYLLVNLLPEARSNGSRRVFVDSFQTVPDSHTRKIQAWVAALDGSLANSCHESIDEEEFHRVTANLIGPPTYAEEVDRRYFEIERELFDEGCQAFERDGVDGVQQTLKKWRRWMNGIGRHSGNLVEKQVLDVLSYECRTALHRCYSAVWRILLPALANRFNLTDESYIFHQLWHFDRCQESNLRNQAYFHPFHGHILGLHPACGPLLLTSRGGELFASWLREGSHDSYHRVLHALTVAIDYYGQQYELTALLRKNEGRVSSEGDMVAMEESQAARRRGRRRRHRPVE